MSEIHNEVRVIKRIFQNKRDIVIFDVGACNFHDSLYFREYFPFAQIYAFEPDRINLQNFSSKASDSHIHILPIALSDNDDSVIFYPSVSYTGNEHRASGSILKPKTRPGTSEGVHHESLIFDLQGYPVQTVRIDTFCNLNEIAHIDFLHMDVQGAESKVLKGLGAVRPTFVFAETCEFDTYESDTTSESFEQLIYDLGYEPVKRFRDDTLYKLKTYECDFSTHTWLPKI